MRVLGVNAVFHDSAAALIVDGEVVAAAEEERFTRRKHAKACVPFSTWELPERAIAWCLEEAGLGPNDLDAVAYSYDPALADLADNADRSRRPNGVGNVVDESAAGDRTADVATGESGDLIANAYEGLRTYYVRRLPQFLTSLFGGFDAAKVHYVRHHVAHAASAYLCAPFASCATLALDGRGERGSFLAGHVRDGRLEPLATVELPHSLGLRYEELTVHLGFVRSSDEYKVMGLAAYGSPRYRERLRAAMYATGLGYYAPPLDFAAYCAPRRADDEGFATEHADLAASVQERLQEILVDIAQELHARTGERNLTLSGGVALNCVANSYLAEHGPFERIWVQPAAGDAGTALGAALYVAAEGGDRIAPLRTAALGRSWDAAQLRAQLDVANVVYAAPLDLAEAVAEVLAENGLVAWFQGRSEFGPRALGHRSLLAHPGYSDNLRRLNDVKGREQFRPVAPMVLAERAADIFTGPLPSPYMLFTHGVRDEWRARIPTVTHVDGTARVQTVDANDEPLMAAVLRAFERRTGLPVLVNTSLNTAGRPIVDEPRDALELFGSTPVDALALGPFLLARRAQLVAAA
ncbi:MAG: carbamoyltransferase [Candidatus Eremiobacteraeota bacterium]|nr:carbamoyltransferase [Candidatus Eremiobacteraeota bacterium]